LKYISKLLLKNVTNFLFLLIVIIFILSIFFQNEVDAISPGFPRQVIIDGSKDWFPKNLLKTPDSKINSTQCNENKSFFSTYPDIEEINYLSDGKFLNATVWLSSFFEEPKQYYNFSFNKGPISKTNSSIDKNIVSLDVKNLDNKNMNLKEYTQQKIFSLKKLPSFTHMDASRTFLSNILAHKVMYEYSKQNDHIKAIKIWTIANDKIYTITYLAEKERFDYYLPSVQNIINSFDIKKNNSFTLNKPSIDDKYQTYVNESLELTLQYPIDWKKEPSKNNPSLIIFYPPYTESLFQTGRIIVMAMDVNSGYDFRGEDYRVTLDWDPMIRNWTRLVQESKASMGEDRTLDSGESLILEQQKNYGGFFNKEKDYVKLSMDLSKINFPDQYSLVFFVIDSYSNRSYTCNIDLFDMSDEVHIPPPEFSFIVSPSSISLRPGEDAKLELQIKNTNAKLNSYVSLSTNTTQDLDIKFIPNSTSVPPSGLSTSVIYLHAKENATDRPYTFSIKANITFPSQLTNYLTNEKFNNTGGARMVKSSDVTVTILPQLKIEEKFNYLITTWFNPITSTYTTIITIITGLLGWSIWKRKKKNKEE
jgi:hypothetical protein